MQSPAVAVGGRLDRLRCEFRGPLKRCVHELETAARSILPLKIGNLGPFGFRVPQHLRDAIANANAMPESEAYCHQQGLPAAYPGAGFEFQYFRAQAIRVTLLPKPEMLNDAFARIQRALERTPTVSAKRRVA